jgi:hypothetical protein
MSTVEVTQEQYNEVVRLLAESRAARHEAHKRRKVPLSLTDKLTWIRKADALRDQALAIGK